MRVNPMSNHQLQRKKSIFILEQFFRSIRDMADFRFQSGANENNQTAI